MDQVIEFVSKYPQLSVVFLVMGVFRAVFKPALLLAEKYVEATPSKDDDEKLAAFKQSKAYQVLSFLADYLLSIKLPK